MNAPTSNELRTPGASHSSGTLLRRLLASRTSTLVLCLLALDILAFYFHQLHLQEVLPSRFFRIARDRGFGELVQYTKYALTIVLLIGLRRESPGRVLTGWLVLYWVILFDDSLGLHEALGKLFAAWSGAGAILGRDPKDVFELVGFALLEGTALLYVFIGYCRSAPDMRRFSVALAIAMSPLFLAGFLLDTLPWHYAEEAGEMLGGLLPLVFLHIYCRRHLPVATAADRATTG